MKIDLIPDDPILDNYVAAIEVLRKDARRQNAGVPKLMKASQVEHYKQYVRVEQKIDDIASTDVDDIARATNYVSASLDAVMAGNEVPVKSTKPYGCGVKYR